MSHLPSVSRVFGWRLCRCIHLAALGYFACAMGGMSVAAQTPSSKDLDTDPQLTGWWKFDESSGTVAKDSSKHDRKGQLAGGLTFDKNSVSGRNGRALKLDGRDNLVRITGYKGVSGTGPRTIAVWIKTNAPNGEIVSWGKDDFGQMWILKFIRKHIGVTPNGGYYYMANDVHDGEWHHVAVVVRKAELPNLHDDVTLYMDSKIAEVDRIGLLDLWPIETGSEQDVTVGKRLSGIIDDLRIYARALSDEEIQAIHRRAK